MNRHLSLGVFKRDVTETDVESLLTDDLGQVAVSQTHYAL